jgi:hypothetical protein
MVTMLIATNAISELSHPTPRIGDIVSFAVPPGKPVEGEARLTVLRPGQLGCILDLNIMRNSGGSIVVEGEVGSSPGRFQAHWAGVRTAADIGNCGASADLILDNSDLDILASAAGGYLVGAVRKVALVTEPAI